MLLSSALETFSVVVATYVANELSSQPLCLAIIGSPAPTLVKKVSELPRMRMVVDVRVRTFASYFQERATSDGEVEPPSVFLMTHFARLLAKRSELRAPTLERLCAFHESQSCAGSKRNIGVIALVDPEFEERLWRPHEVGERFLHWRVGAETVGLVDGQQANHKRLLTRLAKLNESPEVRIPPAMDEAIRELAALAATARSYVHRDRHSREIVAWEVEPQDRLEGQLRHFVRALTIVRGLNEPTLKEFDFAESAAFSSVPREGLRVMACVGGGPFRAGGLYRDSGLKRTAFYRAAGDLEALGVVRWERADRRERVLVAADPWKPLFGRVRAAIRRGLPV